MTKKQFGLHQILPAGQETSPFTAVCWFLPPSSLWSAEGGNGRPSRLLLACQAGSRPLLLPDGQREKSVDGLAGMCSCIYLEYVHLQRALTQMATNSKPPALSLQRCPRIPDGVYLIAGKICGGITKPVTLLNYRVQADTAHTAPVSGPGRRSPIFKLRCSKHAASVQLQPLSSPSPSDCCGEVFFRGSHPPSL